MVQIGCTRETKALHETLYSPLRDFPCFLLEISQSPHSQIPTSISESSLALAGVDFSLLWTLMSQHLIMSAMALTFATFGTLIIRDLRRKHAPADIPHTAFGLSQIDFDRKMSSFIGKRSHYGWIVLGLRIIWDP